MNSDWGNGAPYGRPISPAGFAERSVKEMEQEVIMLFISVSIAAILYAGFLTFQLFILERKAIIEKERKKLKWGSPWPMVYMCLLYLPSSFLEKNYYELYLIIFMLITALGCLTWGLYPLRKYRKIEITNAFMKKAAAINRKISISSFAALLSMSTLGSILYLN